MSQSLQAPLILEGKHVRLESLDLRHVEALADIALDPDLWRWVPARIETRGDVLAYVQAALAERQRGRGLPFVTIDSATACVVGSTRFGNIDATNRRVEIGWTWLARPWQRTATNTEAKYLMLRHAFETFGCIRVEFRTDALNQRSRAAISRLGAVQEGVLRKHLITPSGRVRDTVFYSVIDSEWPAVRERLEAFLGQPPSG